MPSDEDDEHRDWSDSDSGIFSSTENPDEADEEEDADPAAEWRDIHAAIKSTITELGGKVVPKLNWSAPKDATWIANNTMECRSPNDIYLLLKSSDFITHDLEHAFDDCVDDSSESAEAPKTIADIPYHLVLRKYILLNPSVEFRCFVRRRKLVALCQRDLNHFDFLFNMQDKLRDQIQHFFDQKLKSTFPDDNFVFDVYIPPPHNRVWLIDINPWALRTDPLLFSWLELLTLTEPPDITEKAETVVSIPIRKAVDGTRHSASGGEKSTTENTAVGDAVDNSTTSEQSSAESDSEEEADEELWFPEFRLVRKDDPEAYAFTTPQYSAHKMPREVVDASQGGVGSLREFAENWKDILAKRQKQEEGEESEDD